MSEEINIVLTTARKYTERSQAKALKKGQVLVRGGELGFLLPEDVSGPFSVSKPKADKWTNMGIHLIKRLREMARTMTTPE